MHFEDIGTEVRARLPLMCHLYGGITPMNIWSMKYRDFRQMAKWADEYQKQSNKA